MTGDHDFHKRALLRALLLAASLTLGLTASAQAWTVSPADIQLTGKPGLITRGSFEVISSDSVGRHFRVVAQNLGETPTGAFTFTDVEHSAANWIEILPGDFLGSKRAQSVDYAIAIPSNARPGDHVAAISVQELPEGTQGNIGVVEAVGIRLVIHVPGTVYPAAKITSFEAPRLTFGNGVAIHATVVNTGDTVLDFNGANRGSAITIAKESYPLVGLLLPGAKRVLSYAWNNPPLLGSTSAHLRVTMPGRALSASTSIFAFPLYQMLGVMLLALAGYVYRRQRRKRRRKFNSSTTDLVVGGA
jgi:hypothetical protein